MGNSLLQSNLPNEDTRWSLKAHRVLSYSLSFLYNR